MTIKPEKILQVIKIVSLFLVTPWLIFSCTPAQEKTNQKQEPANIPSSYSDSTPDTLSELTPEQQTAFDVLNSIQRKGQHLYSTFPGIRHDCFPPDTSFVISRDELLIAMEVLLKRHYTNISAEERTKLAVAVVLAQEEYLVLQCKGHSAGSADNAIKNVPSSGFWILPKVLGRRDIILEW